MKPLKCSARRPDSPVNDALSFFKAMFNSSTCVNDASYIGPLEQPLCEACAFEQKKAHEEGATVLAIYQQEKLGRILEYRIRPIN